MSRRRTRLLAAAAGLAVAATCAAPLAHAFFFEATDQPLTLKAATPDRYVRLHSAATEPAQLFAGLYERRRAGLAVDPRTFAAAGGDTAPLTVDLGAAGPWWTTAQRTVEGAFTLEATAQLPGDAPVGVTLETDGPLKAFLRRPLLPGSVSQLAEPDGRDADHRARVALLVTSPNANGEYRATVTVKLAFADGSRMRYAVPVAWRDQ